MQVQFQHGDAEWQKWRARCLTDLYWFAGVVLGYGDKVRMNPRVHGLFCKFLDRKLGIPEIDQAPHRKVLMPREAGKTTLGTQAYVIQRILQNPDIAILLANEKLENAAAFLSAIKNEFTSNQLLRELFPEIIPDLKQTVWTTDKIVVQRTSARKEPTIFCIGTGGSVTGMHPDLIVCDDIFSREAMENARTGNTDLTGRINRWISQLRNLLNAWAEPYPEILFIGTHWYAGDPYHFVEEAYGYGEADRVWNVTQRMPDGLMQTVPVRRKGDLAVFKRSAIEDGKTIWPENPKFTEDALAKARIDDPVLFACNPDETPILMGDWSSKRLVDVQVGETVVGFSLPAGKSCRTIPVKVTGKQTRMARTVLLRMASGRVVRCTPDHRWLHKPRGRKLRPDLVYREPAVGRPLCYLIDPVVPPPPSGADVRWLAGIFDGEGCVGHNFDTGKRQGGHLTIAQSAKVNSAIRERILRQLRLLGFAVNEHPTNHGMVFGTNREDRRKFFLWCAPFVKQDRVLGTIYGGHPLRGHDKVVEILQYGEEQVHSLETESGNYVAWGYVSQNCNMQNEPTNELTATFKEHWLRYYTWLDDRSVVVSRVESGDAVLDLDNLDRIILVDPGGFKKAHTGDRMRGAVVVSGTDFKTNDHLILEAWSEQATFQQVAQEALAFCTRYKPRKVAIEEAGQQAAFIELFKRMARDANIEVLVEAVKPASTIKEQRIGRLESFFQRGQMYIGKGGKFAEFREQYRQFPRGRRVDLLDALAYGPAVWRKPPLRQFSAAQRQDAEKQAYYRKRGIVVQRTAL